MNTSASVPLSTPVSNCFTSHFTTLPEYQAKESSIARLPLPLDLAWQIQAKLSPQALNSIGKVNDALKIAKASMEGSLFAQTQYGISVVAMRRQFVYAEANGVCQRYNPEIEALAKQVKNIAKQVKEVAREPAVLEEKKAAILAKLGEISETLIHLRDKVIEEKKELKTSTLANDPRVIKKNIQPFDKLGLQHQTYLTQVQEWQQKQVLTENASEIDCWKWKGKIKAIQRVENQCAYLENSLYAVECSLTSLRNNANNEKFHQPTPSTPEREGVRVFNMHSNMPFPFPFEFNASSSETHDSELHNLAFKMTLLKMMADLKEQHKQSNQ